MHAAAAQLDTKLFLKLDLKACQLASNGILSLVMHAYTASYLNRPIL
jgi:hypothetical protein